MTGFSPKVVALVLERDGGHCFRCHRHVLNGQRGIDYSIHHRCPRGRGGSKAPWVMDAANGLTLCGSATTPGGCHTWVESNREEAIRLGLLVSALAAFSRPENRPANIPVTDLYGTAWWLTSTGRKVPVGPDPEF